MLTVIILTLNEEILLPQCLESLSWAEDKLVFDSGSTDRTCTIAVQYGARVVQRTFDNYAAQRNAALYETDSEWVLFIDADERVSAELVNEIHVATKDKHKAGWMIPRHNYMFGKLVLNAGWYPDYQLRLFKREFGSYHSDRHVHELLDLKGSIGSLLHPIIHQNYVDVSEFISKQLRYAKYEAHMLHNQGIVPRAHNYLLQPIRQFFWRYITLSGWRSGYHGLLLSVLMAYSQYMLYRELSRLRNSDIEFS
mgnify:FL=1